jgi:hypothetical protein
MSINLNPTLSINIARHKISCWGKLKNPPNPLGAAFISVDSGYSFNVGLA